MKYRMDCLLLWLFFLKIFFSNSVKQCKSWGSTEETVKKLIRYQWAWEKDSTQAEIKKELRSSKSENRRDLRRRRAAQFSSKRLVRNMSALPSGVKWWFDNSNVSPCQPLSPCDLRLGPFTSRPDWSRWEYIRGSWRAVFFAFWEMYNNWMQCWIHRWGFSFV